MLRPIRATDSELAQVDELLMVAFGSGSRRNELELYTKVQPDGWFVIEEDDRMPRRMQPPPNPEVVDNPLASTSTDQVLQFDAGIFGGDRSGLLEMLMRGDSGSRLVTHHTAGRLGFLFVRQRLIGPGAAASREVAQALIHDAMEGTSPERNLLLPSESEYLHVLLSLGFVEQQRLTHMRHGDQNIVGARHRLLAQTSYAAG